MWAETGSHVVPDGQWMRAGKKEAGAKASASIITESSHSAEQIPVILGIRVHHLVGLIELQGVFRNAGVIHHIHPS